MSGKDKVTGDEIPSGVSALIGLIVGCALMIMLSLCVYARPQEYADCKRALFAKAIDRTYVAEACKPVLELNENDLRLAKMLDEKDRAELFEALCGENK